MKQSENYSSGVSHADPGKNINRLTQLQFPNRLNLMKNKNKSNTGLKFKNLSANNLIYKSKGLIKFNRAINSEKLSTEDPNVTNDEKELSTQISTSRLPALNKCFSIDKEKSVNTNELSGTLTNAEYEENIGKNRLFQQSDTKNFQSIMNHEKTQSEFHIFERGENVYNRDPIARSNLMRITSKPTPLTSNIYVGNSKNIMNSNKS